LNTQASDLHLGKYNCETKLAYSGENLSGAREYYDSLIAQGYPAHQALSYTQQHFPEFQIADLDSIGTQQHLDERTITTGYYNLIDQRHIRYRNWNLLESLLHTLCTTFSRPLIRLQQGDNLSTLSRMKIMNYLEVLRFEIRAA